MQTYFLRPPPIACEDRVVEPTSDKTGWAAGAPAWVENEAIIDHVFAPVTDALLQVADIRPGHHVLDVGCGTGTLLAEAERRGAAPTGIDIAPDMAAAARRRVATATVLTGDAASADLRRASPSGAGFDRVVSRFGLMFFPEPTAALGSIRQAVRPGGQLAAAVWRTLAENPIFTLGTGPLRDRAVLPKPAPGAPGPTSVSDPDRTRALLDAAGWQEVSIEPCDVWLRYDAAGSDGVAERLTMALANGSSRAAIAQIRPGLSDEQWAGVLDEVRAEIRTAMVDGVVQVPGAIWLVTATA